MDTTSGSGIQDNRALTPIPFVDLAQQHRPLRAEMLSAFTAVLDDEQYIQGPDVRSLESEVASYSDCRYGIGVSSGSDALLASLMAIGIGVGDEVITTPYTFFATAGAIARLGATPVFVDVEPSTLNIDPALIEARITPRTRAILPVHLFGRCADMDEILTIAARYELMVVEDAAQAIGAELSGRRAGSIGNIGCFSFFPSKNLGALGDGGMVTTNDSELAEKIRMLCHHGARSKYMHEMIGGNFRLDTIHAAVLRVKLRHLDNWIAARNSIAETYEACFDEFGLPVERLKPTLGNDRHVFNQYVIMCDRRDDISNVLRANEIGMAIYYPTPLHLQPCFRYLGYSPGSLPIAEAASARSVALPIFPGLSTRAVRTVVGVIADTFGSSMIEPRADR